MFQETIAYLRDINTASIILRLFLAMLFGGIVGLERGSKRRAAGFRTYILVCIGSSLVMITNQYLCDVYNTGDPARLGAQVISGIGFLGAGTIILTRSNHVIGLTTAAGLWASACVGLAIGIGFYEGAIIASLFIFFVITVMYRVDRIIRAKSRSMDLYVELRESGMLQKFLEYAHDNVIRIEHIEFTRQRYSSDQTGHKIAALIAIRLPKRHLHGEIIDMMLKIDGVEYIEET